MTCRSFLSTVISTSSALPSRSSTASATTIITCKYLNNYAPFLPRFYSLKPSLFNKPKPKYISSTSNYLSPNTNLSSNDKDQSQTDRIDPNTLQWSTFFKLKKQLRNWERLGALTLGVTSFVGGSIYFGTVADFDPIEPVFGIDPNIAYGGASFLVGLAGLLTGLQGSGLIWRFLQKTNVLKQLDSKEKQFFSRIKKHRPVEIKVNLQHPLPDYYGEKVGSVREYRHWLRAMKEWCVKMGINK